MEIIVKWEVSYDSGTVTFELDDLGCSEDGWGSLSERERERTIQEAIDRFVDPPSLCLMKYTEV